MQLFLNNHRPRHLEDLVYPTSAVETSIRRYTEQQLPRCLLLYGPYGTGKTVMIDVIARKLAGDEGYESNRALILSGAEATTVGKIARLRGTFGNVPFGSSYHVCQINELHLTPAGAQAALRDVIDTAYNHRSAVILVTANDLGKVDEAVKDRCETIYIGSANANRWLLRAQKILARERISLPDDVLLQTLTQAISNGGGSIRRIMATLFDLVVQAREHKKSLEQPKQNVP